MSIGAEIILCASAIWLCVLAWFIGTSLGRIALTVEEILICERGRRM